MGFPTLVDSDSNSATFIYFTGRLARRGIRVEELDRANVDGEAYRQAGLKAGQTQHMSACDFTTEALAKAEEDKYLDMRGKTATLTDAHGQAFGCVIIDAIPGALQKGALGVGGISSGAVLLTCTWILKATE